MRHILLAATFLACAGYADAAPQRGGDVALALDEVHTLTFKNPIATVYVGNPAIADVTMIDSRHAFVQGKSYGQTNIVALNGDNVQVFNSRITVTGGENGSTVILNRGAERVTLTCGGGHCEPTPMPGDDQKAYQTVNQEVATHQSEARGMATAENKPAGN